MEPTRVAKLGELLQRVSRTTMLAAPAGAAADPDVLAAVFAAHSAALSAAADALALAGTVPGLLAHAAACANRTSVRGNGTLQRLVIDETDGSAVAYVACTSATVEYEVAC